MAEPILYDGVDAPTLAHRLGVPAVELHATVTSTQDLAHERAAEGAQPGTIVLSNSQTSGRGRAGRAWASEPGSGIWLTLIERPTDAAALDVLSLRLGLHVAEALAPFAARPVTLKWPNDLYGSDGKLAGILVETRWRAARAEWTAIGFGVNVRRPLHVARASALRPGTDRLAVLASLVPALRAAAATTGALTREELASYAMRDAARGRRCVAPVPGRVRGITADGAVRIDTGGAEIAVRAGSLVLHGEGT